ncbi:MAG: hypothetical protein IKE94_02990 [Aeriscardovia sp.]|nr:hypothetical protein [Aeriscardovia sp.]
MEKGIELFVPGRLCLLGEHSDWAGKYRNTNEKIEKGYAIVTGIEEGIHAFAYPDERLIIEYTSDADLVFSCDMKAEALQKVAEEGGFFCYIAGTAFAIKERYNVGGVRIVIDHVTLPMKKGLSSSAAICVLVTRAFNQIYHLHLNTRGEMNLAYEGEITTPSRCGKLDQACAYGKKPVLMTFDGDRISVKNIEVGADLYFVFADLKAGKDTIKILADLNRCYPFAQNETEQKVQEYLGRINKENIEKGLELIRQGNAEGLGLLMTRAQEMFDEYLAPACPSELTAPILHQTLQDPHVKSLIYGAKGVGSGGDGAAQFLVKDAKAQAELKQYLEEDLRMTAYILTLNQTKPITKAIIPAAGNGVRMFPISKILRKAFLPIIDKDGIIKPAIMVLLEELDDAGIDRIAIVIDREDRKDYENFFEKELSNEIAQKLSPSLLEYESKIQRIGKKIEYIYQDEKLGLGHAVSLCEEFADGDPVLLVLGDQLYKTTSYLSCTRQLLDSYSKDSKLMISVIPVPIGEVSRYGILTGKIENHDDFFVVDRMVEKPEASYAEEYLFTNAGGEKKYFAVFGEYILTPAVFRQLRENIAAGIREKGEFQLTGALDKVREKEGMIAFLTDGEMLDIGDVTAYQKALLKKMD